MPKPESDTKLEDEQYGELVEAARELESEDYREIVEAFFRYVQSNDEDQDYFEDYLKEWDRTGEPQLLAGGDFAVFAVGLVMIVALFAQDPSLIDYRDGHRVRARRVNGLFRINFRDGAVSPRGELSQFFLLRSCWRGSVAYHVQNGRP